MSEDQFNRMLDLVGRIDERLKIVEKLTYGMAGTVLLAVVAGLLRLVVAPV